MIRALVVMWRSFWMAFVAGFARAIAGPPPPEHFHDRQAMRRAMAEAEAEILAKMPEERRDEARERLHDAMRRYGFAERDRRHQAGRES